LPAIVASSAGGKLANEAGSASEGFWYGYTIARLSPDGDPRKLVVEFIGTFFLVLTIGLTVLMGTELAPLAIGGVLVALRPRYTIRFTRSSRPAQIRSRFSATKPVTCSSYFRVSPPVCGVMTRFASAPR
jgi:hypothetical protein